MAEDDELLDEDEEIDEIIEKGKEIELKPKPAVQEKPKQKSPEVKQLTAHDKAKQSSADLKRLSAQDILTKSEEELKKEIGQDPGKRETQQVLKHLKILTAIMLGKKSNKELSQVLDTDKSFTSKQIKKLEEEGLVHKRGEGKKTQYEVNEFNVMKFLTSRIVLKWSEKPAEKKENDK